MDPQQFAEFRHEAVHELMRLNEICEEEFHIDSFPRWDYELDVGTLTFSKDGRTGVIAKIQVVGSTSKKSGTWLWAWANDSIPKDVAEGVEAVRRFGEAENLSELTRDSSPADEHLGWEMTAITARIVGARGAYRFPDENGFLYVVYSSIRLATEHERELLECSTHGKGFQTFVCKHLVANPAQEWVSEVPSEDNKWPDAWCSSCNKYFEEEGEWSDKNSSHLKVELLCHRCYEKLRFQSTSSTHNS